jgi:hypothetical protein
MTKKKHLNMYETEILEQNTKTINQNHKQVEIPHRVDLLLLETQVVSLLINPVMRKKRHLPLSQTMLV